ncbi:MULTISPECIES: bifunctional NAD(P)H-dependent oxidoreductase/GNAT family N-acetyltransferase [Streptomyces]|uniref:Bifunctional NAD(P)H-dependent oxidoreductase/GNAT family N-acetyltransferase n=1 Tax=Streptomyces chilikensis TaxID=1194079 RepID=A0ABV3EK38_9ACTN|nr:MULTISPECIES: bifunctional NAD(P)H-dependent oxidoreductase/GNAT family N-acetyltransferase [Streptomyces]MDH6223121.1 NAD(P)H-dependent FMN reductase/ribosomal protein S18 acetylase RimI-like enzyme [Streptomyces sp. MJP52]
MSMKTIRVLVLVCSTRPGALGPAVGKWLTGALEARAGELDVELVPLSLGDLGLSFLDEEEEPSSGIYAHEHTRRWSALVDAADGFLVVTPEYNYGMPATLKNALDHLGREWAWKPMGFVSYGHTSAGTRSVQHAKQVVTTLRLVPLGATLAMRIGDTVQDGQVRPGAAAAETAVGVLEELVRVSHALRPLRERSRPGVQAGPLPGSYLRALTPDDAPEVTVLQRCCWVEEALANESLDIPALHESPERVREWMASWTTTGLWRDGRLLGMVRTRRVDSDWHVGRLAVVPDLRGRGLGRWLLRTAETGVDPDCLRVVVHTGVRSERNIRLYRSEGYLAAPPADDGTVCLTKEMVASLAG